MEKALLYEKYRLPYAPEMVDDLLKQVGDTAVVADIGAGTGQLARLLAARSAQVYAVEPDDAMREVASIATKDYPNISILNAAAEQTTLPENSIDLIVIGNAFHRFRPEAIQELVRILKKSGWVAVISYSFSNTAFSELLFSKLRELESLTARSAQTWHSTPVKNLFGDRPTYSLHYTQSLDENQDAFWGAACSGIEAPEQGEEDFAHFRKINQEVFNRFSVEGYIRMDYETTVLFGQPKL